MSARRDEAVLRKCYYCAATLLKKGNYSTAAKAWRPVDTGHDFVWVNQQWQQKYGAPHERLNWRDAQHKCPQCGSKIKAFPPRPASGAVAAVPLAGTVALPEVVVTASAYRYLDLSRCH